MEDLVLLSVVIIHSVSVLVVTVLTAPVKLLFVLVVRPLQILHFLVSDVLGTGFADFAFVGVLVIFRADDAHFLLLPFDHSLIFS